MFFVSTIDQCSPSTCIFCTIPSRSNHQDLASVRNWDSSRSPQACTISCSAALRSFRAFSSAVWVAWIRYSGLFAVAKPCGTGRAIGRRILAHFFRTTHQPVELGVQVSVKVREVDASGLLHLFLAQFPSIHTLKSNSTKRIFHELVSCEFGVQTNWCSANIPMVVLCQDLSQGMLFLLDVLLERRCCDDLGQHVALRSQHDIRPLCTRTAESQVVILGRFACLFDNGIAGLETQGVS